MVKNGQKSAFLDICPIGFWCNWDKSCKISFLAPCTGVHVGNFSFFNFLFPKNFLWIMYNNRNSNNFHIPGVPKKCPGFRLLYFTIRFVLTAHLYCFIMYLSYIFCIWKSFCSMKISCFLRYLFLKTPFEQCITMEIPIIFIHYRIFQLFWWLVMNEEFILENENSFINERMY